MADGRIVTEVAKNGLVTLCVPGVLCERRKSRLQSIASKQPKTRYLHNYYPVARGLPQALAAVRDCASTAPIPALETKEVWPRLTTAVP